MKRYKWTIWLLILLMGCSEVISLKVEEEGGQLIIYGRITDNSEGNIVTVHRTGALGKAPVPVLGARVTIKSENGDSELLVPGDSGRYELEGRVLSRQPGTAYSLEVEVDGNFYHTLPQTMPQNYGRDILSWKRVQVERISTAGIPFTDEVIEVSARTEFDVLPEEFYLKFDIEEAYTYLGTFLPLNHFPLSGGQMQCYVINDLTEQKVFLHNGKENRALAIPEQVIVERTLDKSFQTLHYFNLFRSSLTREAFEYWSRVDDIVNRQGSIFDVAPAAIPGNIIADSGDEEVLGFFEVSSLDITRMAITRRDIPVFIFDECQKRGAAFLELFTVPRDCVQCLINEGIVEEYCLSCGVLPGSTRTRPSYF